MQETSYCPYCYSIKSMLLGNVYCSRHDTSMNDLKTGTLYIRSKNLEETYDHVSRLSIRCNLTGEQYYNAGGNDFLVKPNNYLVVNQGQHYKTSFDSPTEQEVLLVAFQPSFAQGVFHSLVANDEKLLNDPFYTGEGVPNFFEQTYNMDDKIQRIFQRLRRIIDLEEDGKKDIDLDTLYGDLLTRLIYLRSGISSDIEGLKHRRQSTRVELYRRLNIARDYMLANLSQKVTVEQAAKAACLSEHHFKREFKYLFGLSPHQYLLSARMLRAKELLRENRDEIKAVALHAGFENESSFIRQFKQMNGTTPARYRRA